MKKVLKLLTQKKTVKNCIKKFYVRIEEKKNERTKFKRYKDEN